eukprot:9475020-Pyramimonas_sp.AAC.1
MHVLRAHISQLAPPVNRGSMMRACSDGHRREVEEQTEQSVKINGESAGISDALKEVRSFRLL